jgi:hypothetical protein
MHIGDLVKVKDCQQPTEFQLRSGLDFMCECFFCQGNSNRIGFVLGPAPNNSYEVMFDAGMWRLDMFDEARGDVKVIREVRKI